MGSWVYFSVIHIYVLLSYPTEWDIIKLIFQVFFKIILCFVIGYFKISFDIAYVYTMDCCDSLPVVVGKTMLNANNKMQVTI